MAHVAPLVNLAAVAKSPLLRVLAFADERGWRRRRVLWSSGTTYNRDYVAETPDAIRGRRSTCSTATAT